MLTPISEEKSHEFLNDLLRYLILVKSYNCKDINDVTAVCVQLFEQYTKPFYEKWRSLTNLSWHIGYIKRYSSFILSYSGLNFILPYRFLIYTGQSRRPQHPCDKAIL